MTVSAVETYTFLADPDVLIQTQAADPQLANLKLLITQGTAPEHCPPGLRKCFLKDGLLCRECKESATQLTHTQVVIPESLKTQYFERFMTIWVILERRKHLTESKVGSIGLDMKRI